MKKQILIKRVYPTPVNLNQRQKEKMPLSVQESQRHMNADSFQLHDELANPSEEISRLLIVVEFPYPGCTSKVPARLIPLK